MKPKYILSLFSAISTGIGVFSYLVLEHYFLPSEWQRSLLGPFSGLLYGLMVGGALGWALFILIQRKRASHNIYKCIIQQDGLETAQEIWGERAQERQHENRKIVVWIESVIVKELYMNMLISGDKDIGWFEWAVKKYMPEPVERSLSIGCGDGALERHGIILNAAQHFDAYDISPGAVELARKLARDKNYQERVSYHVSNLNEQVFRADTYDVVFASQSLHHISNLEHLFSQVRHCLKPGGLFIINEFVGPNQFQWTDKQVSYAEQALLQIPEKYRRGINSGGTKTKINRPTVEHMNRVDPTEAIRSEDILKLLPQYFKIVEQRDFGGTLLNLILEDIAGNFNSEKEEDVAILQKLFNVEQSLLKSGALKSDFTIVVLRKE